MTHIWFDTYMASWLIHIWYLHDWLIYIWYLHDIYGTYMTHYMRTICMVPTWLIYDSIHIWRLESSMYGTFTNDWYIYGTYLHDSLYEDSYIYGTYMNHIWTDIHIWRHDSYIYGTCTTDSHINIWHLHDSSHIWYLHDSYMRTHVYMVPTWLIHDSIHIWRHDSYIWYLHDFTHVDVVSAWLIYISSCIYGTGWRRCIGCLILRRPFPPKSHIISGSCAKIDLQLKASYSIHLRHPVQPIAFGVSFLQSQISIEILVL